eukprot:GABV01014744.1.p2 GENE.GABV01014744.1~~GABV01014744.1.p2  ORF type:complete len:104 (-),score=34.20 GABV01014744.1:50-319(-)
MAMSAGPPPPSAGRGALLDQIRAGKSLKSSKTRTLAAKPVEPKSEKAKAIGGPLGGAGPLGMMNLGHMAAQMAAARKKRAEKRASTSLQ